MFQYNAYGMGIHSAVPLPELMCADGPAEIIIRLGESSCLQPEEITEECCIRATGDEAYLCWKDVGSFLITDGREILYTPVPNVEERLLTLTILGPVLGMLLHLRGHLVLHASAVAGPGGAMVFLGHCGWGKSTTAAALLSCGFTLLTDDVLAIKDENGSPEVIPGTPNIKLWPEAARALGYTPEELPRVYTGIDKRMLYTGRGNSPDPLPIECVYVIDEGDSQLIEPMRPREAMIEAIRHSYCTRVLDDSEAAIHFGQCARLVKNVTFRRLRIEKDLSTLPGLPRMLVDDIADIKR